MMQHTFVEVKRNDLEIKSKSDLYDINVLAIAYPFDQSGKIINKYGKELVHYTKCLYVETKAKKRICIGTMT